MVYLQPTFFASTRWQSNFFFRFAFPAGSHVVLPVDLPQARPPCVPNMRYAKTLYNKRTFAMGWKSDTDLAAFVFGSILEDVVCQEDGTFPLVSISLITSSEAFKKSSGECFKNPATNPRSSLFFFFSPQT